MNERALKFILRRDVAKGAKATCAFCGGPFEAGAKGGKRMVLDHLDNNCKNNQYWNLSLVHQACNQKKRTYGDYQLIALDRIRMNSAYVPEPAGEATPDNRENENVRLSDALSRFVRDYLEINCPQGVTLDFREAAKAISYLARQRFGAGAPDTIMRHLGVYTSGPAPWALTDVQGTQVISKRIDAGGDGE